MPKELPIHDNHVHLDPTYLGVDAVKIFKKHGGKSMLVVHRPYAHHRVVKWEDFMKDFEITIDIANKSSKEADVKVLVAVGPHPVEFVRLWREKGKEHAISLYEKGVEVSFKLYDDKKIDAIGEVGRPHFKVSNEIWEESNRILRIIFDMAAERDCPLILHTESSHPKVFKEISEMAKYRGMKLDKVIKHYSSVAIHPDENFGLFPSVIAKNNRLEEAVKKGVRFMAETDYLDDSSRPGAVLGPATVPRKFNKMLKNDDIDEEKMYIINKENPEKIYGVELD